MTRDEGLALFDGITEAIARVEQTGRVEMLGLRAWLDEKFKSVAKDGEHAEAKIESLKLEREKLANQLLETEKENKTRDRWVRYAAAAGAGVIVIIVIALKLFGIIRFT
jgi:hypothetical protein